jgi:hypothetical protein
MYITLLMLGRRLFGTPGALTGILNPPIGTERGYMLAPLLATLSVYITCTLCVPHCRTPELACDSMIECAIEIFTACENHFSCLE